MTASRGHASRAIAGAFATALVTRRRRRGGRRRGSWFLASLGLAVVLVPPHPKSAEAHWLVQHSASFGGWGRTHVMPVSGPSRWSSWSSSPSWKVTSCLARPGLDCPTPTCASGARHILCVFLQHRPNDLTAVDQPTHSLELVLQSRYSRCVLTCFFQVLDELCVLLVHRDEQLVLLSELKFGLLGSVALL